MAKTISQQATVVTGQDGADRQAIFLTPYAELFPGENKKMVASDNVPPSLDSLRDAEHFVILGAMRDIPGEEGKRLAPITGRSDGDLLVPGQGESTLYNLKSFTRQGGIKGDRDDHLLANGIAPVEFSEEMSVSDLGLQALNKFCGGRRLPPLVKYNVETKASLVQPIVSEPDRKHPSRM